MRTMKQAVLTAVAKNSRKTAIRANGAVSWVFFHQPVEPKSLKRLKK